jgi:hypothetical protein
MRLTFSSAGRKRSATRRAGPDAAQLNTKPGRRHVWSWFLGELFTGRGEARPARGPLAVVCGRVFLQLLVDHDGALYRKALHFVASKGSFSL